MASCKVNQPNSVVLFTPLFLTLNIFHNWSIISKLGSRYWSTHYLILCCHFTTCIDSCLTYCNKNNYFITVTVLTTPILCTHLFSIFTNFFKDLFCVSVCFAWMSACMSCAHKGQNKKSWIPWNLSPVGTRNKTWVLCRSSKWS